VVPVPPGMLGFAAAEESLGLVLVLCEPESLRFMVLGEVIVEPALPGPVVVLVCAIAKPIGAAIKAAAMSKARDLDMISASFKPRREEIQAATDL
jgi:hypothetical protein